MSGLRRNLGVCDMDNLEIYNAVRTPPKEALKPIAAFWLAGEIVTYSRRMFGRALCPDCQRRVYRARKDGSVC